MLRAPTLTRSLLAGLLVLAAGACGNDREPQAAGVQAATDDTTTTTAPPATTTEPPTTTTTEPATTTTTEPPGAFLGHPEQPTVGVTCETFWARAGDDGNLLRIPGFGSGVVYASSPAGLVFWAYSDSGGVQHFGSLVDGTVIGPFPHDSPDAAAYDTLAGEAFEAEATAVTFAAYPAAVSCEQEYQLGTSPGM